MQLLKLQARPDPQANILCGWKRIATYLDMSVRSVQRYEKEQDLPVRRAIGKSRGAVMATITELDGWVSTRAAQPDSSGSEREFFVGVEELRSGVNRMHDLLEELQQLRQEMRHNRNEMLTSARALMVAALQQHRKAKAERARVFGPSPLVIEAQPPSKEISATAIR